MENISSRFWEYIETQRNKKIGERVYQWLNCDNLGAIILDKNVFWIEKTSSLSSMPNYIYKYLKNWGKKQGYIYLYDIKTN